MLRIYVRSSVSLLSSSYADCDCDSYSYPSHYCHSAPSSYTCKHSVSLLSLPLSLSPSPLSLSLLLPFPFAFLLALRLCLFVRHLQGVARRTHNFATNPRGGWCKQASNQPAERGGQFGSKQRGNLKHADNEQPARRPASHTAKLSSGQPARGRPARRPSSQLVCLSASQPANQQARVHRGIHRGSSCLLLPASSLSQPQQANRSDASLSLYLCVGVRSSYLMFALASCGR